MFSGVSLQLPFRQTIPDAHPESNTVATSSHTHDDSNRPDIFSTLPREALVRIFELLESPRAFSKVCKRFNALANDPWAVAGWLLCRFGTHHALYYAIIAMPSFCDDRLIQYLVNRGGRVPRCLVQKTVAVYGKPVKRDRPFDQAVTRMPFTGYASLIQTASQLFGNDCISDLQSDFDMFTKALHQAKSTGNADLLHSLMDNYAFTSCPLPPDSPLLNIRNLLWIARTHPNIHRTLFSVFEIDPSARQCLWEALFLLFLDLAFITIRQESHKQLLQDLKFIIHPDADIHFANAKQDQDIFCAAMAVVLRQCPAGYQTEYVIAKMLDMVTLNITPAFSITNALHCLLREHRVRSDIHDAVAAYLNDTHPTPDVNKQNGSA